MFQLLNGCLWSILSIYQPIDIDVDYSYRSIVLPETSLEHLWNTGGCDYEALFWSFPFSLTGLQVCVHVRIRLSLSPWLCSVIWGQVLKHHQDSSFWLGLLWVAVVFCVSIWSFSLSPPPPSRPSSMKNVCRILTGFALNLQRASVTQPFNNINFGQLSSGFYYCEETPWPRQLSQRKTFSRD